MWCDSTQLIGVAENHPFIYKSLPTPSCSKLTNCFSLSLDWILPDFSNLNLSSLTLTHSYRLFSATMTFHLSLIFLWPSQLGLQNTLKASLQRGKTPSMCFFNMTLNKQSDGETPVMLELWGMQSTSLLPSLPGPLWFGVVAPDRVLSMGRIKLCIYAKLNCLK